MYITFLRPCYLITPLECKHESPATCSSCNSAIESVIDAFTNSISEYLTGESARTDTFASSGSEQQIRKGLERAGLSKSNDNLSSKYSSFVDLAQQFNERSEWTR